MKNKFCAVRAGALFYCEERIKATNKPLKRIDLRTHCVEVYPINRIGLLGFEIVAKETNKHHKEVLVSRQFFVQDLAEQALWVRALGMAFLDADSTRLVDFHACSALLIKKQTLEENKFAFKAYLEEEVLVNTLHVPLEWIHAQRKEKGDPMYAYTIGKLIQSVGVIHLTMPIPYSYYYYTHAYSIYTQIYPLLLYTLLLVYRLNHCPSSVYTKNTLTPLLRPSRKGHDPRPHTDQRNHPRRIRNHICKSIPHTIHQNTGLLCSQHVPGLSLGQDSLVGELPHSECWCSLRSMCSFTTKGPILTRPSFRRGTSSDSTIYLPLSRSYPG